MEKLARPLPHVLYEHVLAGWPTTKIADHYGCHRTTAHKWLRAPAYARYVRDVVNAARSRAVTHYASDLDLALRTLRRALNDERLDERGRPVVDTHAKINAARALLEVHGRVAGEVVGGAATDEIDDPDALLAKVRSIVVEGD